MIGNTRATTTRPTDWWIPRCERRWMAASPGSAASPRVPHTFLLDPFDKLGDFRMGQQRLARV